MTEFFLALTISWIVGISAVMVFSINNHTQRILGELKYMRTASLDALNEITELRKLLEKNIKEDYGGSKEG